MASRPTLFLIDGSNQMYRAYHAIRGLSGPDGESTNAVYGFVTMLRKLIADHSARLHRARRSIWRGRPSATRSSRTTRPIARRCRTISPSRSPWVHEACEALGVPIVNAEGFEADDVIGTLATKAAAAGFDVAIVTGDKDFFQLVGGPIRVFNPRDEGAWFDADGVVQKFGVRPDQVVDVLALMGDSIDNIKGVPGIGEKGARELIARARHRSTRCSPRPAQLPQKRYREALHDARGRGAAKPRTAADPDRRATCRSTPSAFTFAGANRERCYELFSRLGFRIAADWSTRRRRRRSPKHYDLVWTTREELSRLADDGRAAPARSACTC